MMNYEADLFKLSANGLWTLHPEPEPEPEPDVLTDLSKGLSLLTTKISSIPSWTYVTALVVLLTIKIAMVAHGDLLTMRAILSSSSLGDLAAPATLVILQTSSILLAFAAPTVALAAQNFWKLQMSRIIVVSVWAIGVIAITSIALPYTVFFVVNFLTALFFWLGWDRKKLHTIPYKRRKLGTDSSPKERFWGLLKGAALLVISVVALVVVTLNVFLGTSFWGPPQVLRIGDSNVVAYVISDGEVATSLMKDDDRSLMIINNNDLTSVHPCKLEGADRTIYALMPTSANAHSYPWCYGPPKVREKDAFEEMIEVFG